MAKVAVWPFSPVRDDCPYGNPFLWPLIRAAPCTTAKDDKHKQSPAFKLQCFVLGSYHFQTSEPLYKTVGASSTATATDEDLNTQTLPVLPLRVASWPL